MTVSGPGVAIVTGGARGIGRAVALTLAEAGHPVAVNDTGVALDGGRPSPEPAWDVVDEIGAAGGRAMGTAADARTRSGAEQVVADVERWAGQAPTVLVHAAGTLRDAMIHKASDEDWSEVIGSHLSVAVELTRALAGNVRERGSGRIVYVGGAAGLVGSVGQASYDVAKAALFGLTRAVALEMANRDVCVNYVAPFAFTRMTESIPEANDRLRDYLRAAPGATPADVAPLVTWLCSDAASGITGQVFGARGAEIALWSQPRPVAALVHESGWDAGEITARLRLGFGPHLTPVESEFDLFGGPPVAVVRSRSQPPAPTRPDRAPARPTPTTIESAPDAPMPAEVADADAARRIGAGYVDAVGKVIASHVRNELAGATVFDEPAIALAPDPREKWLACRIAMEEYGHHLRFARLAGELGLSDPLAGRALSVFDHELSSWVEFVVLKAIVDLAEVVLMEELVQSSYLPLRDLARALLPEERFHVSFGAVRTRELARQASTRAAVQEAVDVMVGLTLPFFGRSRSVNNDAFRRWGIKHRTNDEARAIFVGRSRGFVVDELGLEYPQVSVAVSW